MSTRKYLTQSEIIRLLTACRTSRHPERNSCLIYMCYIHGLRASEALSLKLSDINLESRELYVHRLKNGFSVNHPLIEEEVLIIQEWLDVRNTLLGAEKEWLFITERGTPMTRQRFYQLFSRLGQIAQLTLGIHPHMLRHACGYALADRGG
ncbi:tyrosine-type recombinase/integrase [Providencia sp. Me31A]|uniref:tyrosine-type recombinase/integrase n=1 Tax=Providencia sp. Me31A TaxID=3392637 RepID=UPI003D286493